MTQRMTFQEAANVIKQGLDILTVIGRYLPLKRAGRSYTGLCPFHKEKSPSFHVSPDKQVFHCFGCGAGGDTLAFLMKHENKTYGELIWELADEHGIDIIREAGEQPQSGRDELDILRRLQSLAQQFYASQLLLSDRVKSYLAEREVDSDWQAHFGLGYAPEGWENLVRYLKQEEPAVRDNPMLLEKAGLANIRSEGNSFYDRFRHRLIIPIHDDRGRIVAFGGRSLDPEDNPKYLNSPETPIYAKSRVLYGLSQAKDYIRTAGYAVLMEGYFDVISAHIAGIPQAVGVCGTALTEGHLKLLQRAGANTLYLCFDSDSAGQTAAMRAVELVQNQVLEQNLTLRVIQLPGEKDPDDFLKSQGRERFLECMAQAVHFLDFKFNQALAGVGDLQSPQGRIQAVQVIVPILAAIHQPVVRHEYLRMMAERVRVAEETLMLEVKRLEQKKPVYGDKKNLAFSAISDLPERYKGRKANGKQQRQYRPEDMSVFRRSLSQKIPLEEKEHLLLSYLFLNEESYTLVMNTLSQMPLQSRTAHEFLKIVSAMDGTWHTINELISKVQDTLHLSGDVHAQQFLAQRLVVADELHESYENQGRGLKTFDPREKLSRDVADIVNRLSDSRERSSLTTLARDVQQQDSDEMARDVQLQLREALKARRKPGQISPTRDSITLEEEQGV